MSFDSCETTPPAGVGSFGPSEHSADARPRRDLLRSGVAVGVSQAAFSIGNLLLLVAVSRLHNTEEVGRVAIVLVVFQISLGLTRAVLGEVALVRTSILRRLDTDQMVRSSLLVGACVGFVLVGIDLAAERRFGSVAVLGCFMPLLVTQDSLRYASFAAFRPVRAAIGDLAWLFSFVCVVTVASASGRDLSPAGLLVVWCACGGASIGLIDLRAFASGWLARSSWVWDSRHIAVVYLPDYALNLATAMLPSVFVAIKGGVSEVGGLRLALSYLGPVSVLWTSLVNVATPALAGRRRTSIRLEIRIAFVAMATFAAWSAVGVVIPGTLTRLVGESWRDAARWVPWLGLGFFVTASYSGAIVGLRSRNRAADAFRSRAWSAPLTVAAPCLGFWLGSRAGFGIGMAVGAAATSVLVWRALTGQKLSATI